MIFQPSKYWAKNVDVMLVLFKKIISEFRLPAVKSQILS